MLTREYGTAGPVVVLLHGGPGAAGYLAPVARELAGSFRVLEPFQRGSGGAPLTVARHVQDLLELIELRCAGAPPATWPLWRANSPLPSACWSRFSAAAAENR